jgi:ABC-type glycerol-3-phosphate transport system permease component
LALRNLFGSQLKEWNVVMAGTLIAAMTTLLIDIIIGRDSIRGL